MGATTYEWVVDHEQLLDQPGKWHDYYGDVPSWVFSHRKLPAVPGANINFVTGDVRPVHELMTAAASGRNVWVIGGGELAEQFADLGLLDEIILAIAPVILGGGASLLPTRLTAAELTLTDSSRDDTFAYLTYHVQQPTGTHAPATEPAPLAVRVRRPNAAAES